jgi:hypothetical protein
MEASNAVLLSLGVRIRRRRAPAPLTTFIVGAECQLVLFVIVRAITSTNRDMTRTAPIARVKVLA